jgi:hypothetical protein
VKTSPLKDPAESIRSWGESAADRDHHAAPLCSRVHEPQSVGGAQTVAAPGGVNNTAVVGGDDAGYGSCSVRRETGDVIHRLQGALTPDDAGMEVARTLKVRTIACRPA